MSERNKALFHLPEAGTQERVFSIMATQSALGLCFTIELLELAESNRQNLLDLLTGIEQLILNKKTEMGSVIGGSAINLIQRVRAGDLDRRVDHQKIIKAIIGLARTAQLLDGQVNTGTESNLYSMCLALGKLANDRGIIVGNSTVELAREVLSS